MLPADCEVPERHLPLLPASYVNLLIVNGGVLVPAPTGLMANGLTKVRPDPRSLRLMRLLQFLALLCLSATAIAAPPGVTVTHSPASSQLYIGSPSICILPNGDYLASHDLFGPKSNERGTAIGLIFRSQDQGASWKQIAELNGFFWQNLFVFRGAVHAMGTDKQHGRLVIRRSTDGGEHWTEPTDAAHGLLAEGEWHTAPVPMVEHDGRLWRAVEDAMNGTKWGERYRAHLMSMPLDADPLNAASWTISNPLPRDPSWLGGDFSAWLEGNAVVTPDGHLINLLRVDNSKLPEKAAIVRATEPATITFDPEKDFIDFPGGAKKFSVRKDPKGDGYWSLASIVPANTVLPHKIKPDRIRNTVALVHSKNLRDWEVRCVLLSHPDAEKHGFQYLDWQFDGEDLIAVCRVAWDDEGGGAHSYHDANFLMFHRWKSFRQLSHKDDVPAISP